jgi:hypothetical protein
MMMIRTDEDDEFDRIGHENKIRNGQPYLWDIYISPSQRNQVLEECAKLAEEWELTFFAQTIRDKKE